MPLPDETRPASVLPDVNRWPVGGAAGGLGALPILALARSVASRLFHAPGLPGAERVAGEVKEATYAEIAALFVAVPAAVVLFGVIIPRFLRARGRSWWAAQMPGIGFGISLLLWRAGLSATGSLVAGALLAGVGLFADTLGRSRSVLLLILLGLFLGGLSAYRSETGLDLFEDGQILLGARTLAHGGRPYLDYYPIHGWGADGGWDAVLFRLFGDRLDVFRWRRAAMTGLTLVFLALASAAFFRDHRWAVAGMLGCLGFCPFVSERQMLPFACWAAVLFAAQSDSPRAPLPQGPRAMRALWALGGWTGAGAIAALTLFSTLDFGMVFLAAGIAAPILLAALERRPLRDALGATGRFAAGFGLGSLPFLIYLASRGSLAAFLRTSFREIPAEVSAEWGLPAPSVAQAAREGSFANLAPGLGLWLLLGVLTVAATVLVLRAVAGGIRTSDRAAAVSVLVGMIALRGALGRSEAAHWMLYGIFAGLPATWLVREAIQSRIPRGRVLAGALAVLAFVVLLRPDHAFLTQVALVTQAPARRRAEREASVRVPELDGAMLRREQADDLLALKAVVDQAVGPQGTFFDFGNQPGLYFALRRRAPVRYNSVPCYESEEKQREVIAALERERPALAILASGTFFDAFDGISSRDRVPLVARYLDEHYPIAGKVGLRTIAHRRESTSRP